MPMATAVPSSFSALQQPLSIIRFGRNSRSPRQPYLENRQPSSPVAAGVSWCDIQSVGKHCFWSLEPKMYPFHGVAMTTFGSPVDRKQRKKATHIHVSAAAKAMAVLNGNMAGKPNEPKYADVHALA